MRTNPGPSPWKALKRTVKGKRPVVVQAGANTGAEIRPFKNMWPHATIYAFEPRTAPNAELHKNAKKYTGVHVLTKALSDVTGKTTLHVNMMEGTSSLYPINTESSSFRPDYTEKATIMVDGVVLDDFIKDGYVNLLYADTQGSELNILKGAKRLLSAGRIGVLFLEVFFVELYKGVPLFRDIRQELDKHGYKLEGLYCVAKWYGTGQTMWADALFTKGD